jgi:hypothetical protein
MSVKQTAAALAVLSLIFDPLRRADVDLRKLTGGLRSLRSRRLDREG